MALLPSLKTLLIRLASALAAILVVALLFYFFEKDAIRVLSLFAVLVGCGELVSLLFKAEDPKPLKILFYAFTLAVFTLSSILKSGSEVYFTFFFILFTCVSITSASAFPSVESLLYFLGRALLGFFYVGLLPSFVFKLYYLDQALTWFFMLLTIVFAGDTFAYLFGALLGKKKMAVKISPKKTVAGAIGGLVGSVVFALVFAYFIKSSSQLPFLGLGLVLGAFAQFGDLFESLIKRVANQKDSGSIMPGHGGILDRIDGVLFGAPIIYFFATWYLAN